MMIPLRHELTVAEHGTLPFPGGHRVRDGADRRGSRPRRGQPVFVGIALGALYQLVRARPAALGRERIRQHRRAAQASVGAELSPLFLGVGYLIGARIAAIMLAGGLLAWVVLIPAFDLLSGSRAGTLLGLPGRSRRLRCLADLARLRALRRRRCGRLRRPVVDRARGAGDVARRIGRCRAARRARCRAAAHRDAISRR